MGLAGSWISHFARHQFRLGSLFNRNPHQSTLAPSSYIQPRHSRISATHARLKQDLFGRGVSPLQYFNWRNPCCRIEAICGSDLHLYDWFIPTKEARDIPGHEFMGVVEDMCRDVTNLKRGDRLVVHFTIACGNCIFCKEKIWSRCDNRNPNAHLTGSRSTKFRHCTKCGVTRGMA